MRVYVQFIIKNFLTSLIYVTFVVYCLIFILNLLTEFEFFREIDVKAYFPIYLSLLNSPHYYLKCFLLFFCYLLKYHLLIL